MNLSEIYYIFSIPFISANLILILLSIKYITNRKIFFLTLFILSGTFFTLSHHPSISAWPKPIIWLIFSGRFSALFFLWIFTQYLFYDTFHIRHSYWLILLLKIALPFIFYFESINNAYSLSAKSLTDPIPILIIIINIGLLIHIIYIILKEWRQDLVNSRLRLRFIFLFGLIVLLLIAITMRVFIKDINNQYVFLAMQGFISILLYLLFPFLLQLKTTFLGEFNFIEPDQITKLLDHPPNTSSKKSKTLVPQLKTLMLNEKVFLNEKLTIGKLAAMMDTESHLLREAINIHLGYRNFNTFLNRYRINQIIDHLQDEHFQDYPILRLVMDAGFNSLSSFYRAYNKEKEAMNLKDNPNDYRK